MRSVTLSSVFEFVPVSFEEITNCLRFTRCAPALNRLRNNKNHQNEIANIRREQIIHVERRRRFYLFVISWWWVINSIENGRKGEKRFFYCVSHVIVHKSDCELLIQKRMDPALGNWKRAQRESHLLSPFVVVVGLFFIYLKFVWFIITDLQGLFVEVGP
jgi:hypothetical protein